MTHRIRMLAPALLLIVAACDRGPDQSAAGNADLAGANDAAANDTAAAAPSTQSFVENAAASDMYEIEAGKLASEKAANADVKAFGQMLVTDHTKSSTEMKAAASQADPALAPPAVLPADKQAMVDALKAASGADFDRLFLSQQVEAHSAALQLLQGYAAGGEAEPLKAFAAKTAPVVEAHLEKARSLQQ